MTPEPAPVKWRVGFPGCGWSILDPNQLAAVPLPRLECFQENQPPSEQVDTGTDGAAGGHQPKGCFRESPIAAETCRLS